MTRVNGRAPNHPTPESAPAPQPGPRQHTIRTKRTALTYTAAVTVFATLAVILLHDATLFSATIGAILGLIIATLETSYRVARRHLGRATAWAAVTLATSLLAATLTALLPTCPGNPPGTGCTRTDIGAALLIGTAMPALTILAIAWIPLTWHLARKLHHLNRDHGPAWLHLPKLAARLRRP